MLFGGEDDCPTVLPGAVVVGDVPDMLAGRVATRIVPGVSYEVGFSDLVLLLVFHHVFYHGSVAAVCHFTAISQAMIMLVESAAFVAFIFSLFASIECLDIFPRNLFD